MTGEFPNKTATGPADPQTGPPDTWPRVLEYNSHRYGASGKAMRYKHYGIWQSYSWLDYYRNVKYLALGLLALGFQPGRKLLIIGDNAPEWYFGELAAQSLRGISVGLYSDLSAAEISYIAADCEAEFALVEDQEQADKLEQILPRLPHLKKVIYWRYKGLVKGHHPLFCGFRDVLKMGRSYENDHPAAFEQSLADGRPEDVCAIIYTSGATGAGPRGALHSYRSLQAAGEHFMRLEKLSPRDNLVSYLPPAWITEQWLALGCHLLCAGTVNFAENAETQQQDIREIAPSVVLYTARLWERQAGRVRARIQSAGSLKKLAFRCFMPAGYRLADLRYQQRRPGPGLRLWHFLAYWLVFRPVRDSLGLPHARVCYTTGAILSPDILRFYHALGIPLKNIYASTEAGLLTIAAGRDFLQPNTGSLVNGADLRLTSEGEITAAHTGVFLGYYRDPELTARTLVDGRVRTGDAGLLTEDNRLVFLDRLADLVRLPGGRLLAPQDIESRLKSSPYIRDAWVPAAADAPAASAVIIIDADNTGHWADKHKVAYTTFGDLSQKTEIYDLIESELRSLNRDLGPGGRIHKFVNLHKEFDPDEEEMTRTRKLRKGLLREKYRPLLDALAGDRSSVGIEARFTYQDGRAGSIRTELKIKTVQEGPA